MPNLANLENAADLLDYVVGGHAWGLVDNQDAFNICL
jgi:hypothetical protein